MLARLSIRDIVLIERLDIEFSRGLAVLTGETGAGKSILLDAFALALGGLYVIEGIGLACRVRAAVYLTVLTTVALIPVEVWWLWSHPGRLKEVALAVNVALNARLIPAWSIEGAAWATLGTEVCLTVGCLVALGTIVSRPAAVVIGDVVME